MVYEYYNLAIPNKVSEVVTGVVSKRLKMFKCFSETKISFVEFQIIIKIDTYSGVLIGKSGRPTGLNTQFCIFI